MAARELLGNSRGADGVDGTAGSSADAEPGRCWARSTMSSAMRWGHQPNLSASAKSGRGLALARSRRLPSADRVARLTPGPARVSGVMLTARTVGCSAASRWMAGPSWVGSPRLTAGQIHTLYTAGSQTAWNTDVSGDGASDSWSLGDTGTTAYTGPVPDVSINPCSMVDATIQTTTTTTACAAPVSATACTPPSSEVTLASLANTTTPLSTPALGQPLTLSGTATGRDQHRHRIPLCRRDEPLPAAVGRYQRRRHQLHTHLAGPERDSITRIDNDRRASD